MRGVVVVEDGGKGQHAETLAEIINNVSIGAGEIKCVSESLWANDKLQVPVGEWGGTVAAKIRSVSAVVLAIDVGIHGYTEEGALLIVKDLVRFHEDVLEDLKAIALFSKNFRLVKPLLEEVRKLVRCEVEMFDRNQERTKLVDYIVRRALGVSMK